MQFAEVAVDTQTGVVTVERVYALQACGLVVNRLTAENQVIGGVIQGISYALFEDRMADPVLGYQLNADLLHYKIAGALDVPVLAIADRDRARLATGQRVAVDARGRLRVEGPT